MNPALTTSLLKSANSLENNVLSSAEGATEGLSSELFSGELSAAMKDVLSANGKHQPLNLATLKEIGIQQLTELEELNDIPLPGLALELKQQTALNNLSVDGQEQIKAIDLFGNPEANGLLKTNLVNDDLLEEGGLTKGLNKTEVLVAGKVITGESSTQQSMLSKDMNLSKGLDEFNLSQYMKDFGKNSGETSTELLTQLGRQEVNTSKLVEQLSNIDKPINTINPLSNAPIKNDTNFEPTRMMNRIEVPVNQPGWGEAVGSRLMTMVNGKVQSASIHLNPAELGPIEIRVNVNQEQASVHFVSNNAAVRDAIEDAFPRLKEMFSQSGLNLSDANVSQESSKQSNQYSSDKNDSSTILNNESSESDDVQIETTNENIVDIGFVDHYV